MKAAETINQPSSGSAAVVDEVHPDYLTLDVGGIVLDVTPLQECLWSLGSVPAEWKTGMLIPILKIGGFLKEGDPTPQPFWEGAYVLDWRVQPLLKPQIQE